jgi:hypothetical protein
MITNTYKCDRCDYTETVAPSEKPKTHFVSVGICLDWRLYPPDANYPRNYQHWCHKCATEVGLHPPIHVEDQQLAPEKEPSVEEQLIEVLRCFVRDNIL